MGNLRSETLAPPKDLVNSYDSVVIVSCKRPVCVYFDRFMELLKQKIFKSNPGSTVEVELTGIGASIPRCEQVARYAMQQLRTTYKHLVKQVEKRKSRSQVNLNDCALPDMIEDEFEAILNASAVSRTVNTITITIQVVVA